MSPRTRLVVLLTALAAAACACTATSTNTATAEKFIGQPAGETCDAATQNEGCLIKIGGVQARMTCSALTGLWQEKAICKNNEVCKQTDDPSDATGATKVTKCQAVFVPRPVDGGGDAGADGGTDAGSTDTGKPKTDTGTVLPTAKEVDPKCIDGKYKEPLPNSTASLAPEFDSYSPEGVMTFIYGVLGKRYPFGKLLVEGAIKNGKQNCVDLFLPQNMRGSPTSVMSRMGVLVHECGHMNNIYPTSFGSSKYAIYFDLEFKCSGLRSSSTDTGSATGNSSFPRSLIKGDSFVAKRPPCETGKGSHGCDNYAKIYLNGDPKNGKFESGDQGFDLLFEEVVQYVNSLASGYAFKDQSAGIHSDRDGILTFLWYLERYLHMARTQYPAVHKTILNDTCWRELVLTVWGRAWLLLEATESFASLGMDDDKIIELVRDPTLLAEIALVRQAAGCK